MEVLDILLRQMTGTRVTCTTKKEKLFSWLSDAASALASTKPTGNNFFLMQFVISDFCIFASHFFETCSLTYWP